MIEYTPLYHRLLVQREKVDDVSEGGIVIPDSAKEKPDRGVVVATGQGRLDSGASFKDRPSGIRPLIVQIGDKVVFSKYAGTEVAMGREDLIVLSEDDVLAVITGEEDLVEEEEGDE